MNTRSNIVTAGQTLIGQKGFSAVGLAEILKSAGVPKGSFYHFFASKDAFGAAVLDDYFDAYHAEMDEMFGMQGLTPGEKLMLYFANWREHQRLNDCQGRCLAVKLGAEVSDFSETMRHALKQGTDGIISRLANVIETGREDGSLRPPSSSEDAAANLYALWVGASIMVKISREQDAFDAALINTRQMLKMAAS
ncbi:TetR/AcrR family transcriptional regulator [Ruegeria lacuscaerulensis]|uniref:TetR/AcrR family transcriptional regulator n=1 Tax=Ruegeria lacuscaerulensis TaxID=55218 RepID=UPI00147CA398|nr:TetR/AcrR family transcriptional regulator [Ruegeria lacuscaerulensis]